MSYTQINIYIYTGSKRGSAKVIKVVNKKVKKSDKFDSSDSNSDGGDSNIEEDSDDDFLPVKAIANSKMMKVPIKSNNSKVVQKKNDFRDDRVDFELDIDNDFQPAKIIANPKIIKTPLKSNTSLNIIKKRTIMGDRVGMIDNMDVDDDCFLENAKVLKKEKLKGGKKRVIDESDDAEESDEVLYIYVYENTYRRYSLKP